MLKTLQAGRGFAALSVVAFHLSLMMGVPRYGGQPIFEEYTSRGHLGVDFFFILSGFVILFAHAEDIGRPGRWGRYAYRRFVRLFPIYWLYTGTFLLLIALGFGTEGHLSGGVLDVLANAMLVKLSSSPPPISVAWSLFHEIAFYAIFSVLILHKRAGLVLFALWAAVCLVFFHFQKETPFQVYTAAFNLYFLFGMGAYFLFKQPGFGALETVAGLAVFGVTLATFPSEHLASRLLVVAGLTLILIGVAKLELRGYIKVPAVLSFLGDASYSIYLTHLAFAGVLLKGVTKAHLAAALGGEGVYMVVFAGTVSLACLAYWFVERPLLNGMRSRRTGVSVSASSPNKATAGH